VPATAAALKLPAHCSSVSQAPPLLAVFLLAEPEVAGEQPQACENRNRTLSVKAAS